MKYQTTGRREGMWCNGNSQNLKCNSFEAKNDSKTESEMIAHLFWFCLNCGEKILPK